VVNEEIILNSDQHRHNYIPCHDSVISHQIISTNYKRKASEELFIQPKKKYFKIISTRFSTCRWPNNKRFLYVQLKK
jgi:hypothetical protein